MFVRSWATNLPGADSVDTGDPNAWSSLQLYRFDRATREMRRLPITTDESSGSWNPVFAPSGEIAAMFAEGAAVILLIDVDTGDWMPAAAEDGPFTLVNSYQGAAFDESGSLMVFAASTDGDTTAPWATSVYATGLPEADPTAEVYLPPPHPLPPAEAPADDVVPTPPPVAAPPPPASGPAPPAGGLPRAWRRCSVSPTPTASPST